ncbi:putative CdaR family transcriptional regulator [Selenomonas ruminantium subsp. lactilytica TAM6421]|uniref:Putative CdaR family transcriptional regulator n=1 Tax=Selenomonas ruminantium subsp. lactilytica (strain NBRC 103574 / TAM6421) TaxID=927704 RepID=I0GMS4_SELRL|nr:helix-turn-helix domain-containing protein [Selenomonas ruminantium]BAL82061.1 putative CdaR family transcriptional regulator [Selenomonas ruminantium subsp. lactilytica TAM6421]
MEKDKEELWQAEDIAGKLRVVHGYTGMEMVLLDRRGDLRGGTARFREESLSLLRRKQQALQQKDFAPFAGLTVVPLVQNKYLWGWLAADCPRESMAESAYCLFLELSLQLTFLLWHEGEMNAMVRRHREQFLYDILYHNFASSDEVIEMGKNWNMRLEKPHHVVVVEFDRPLQGERREQLLEDLDKEWMRVLSARFVQPILMLLRMQLVILFEDDHTPPRSQSEVAKIMADAMAEVKKDFPTILPFSVGIGRLHYSVAEICRSFQEARQALSLGRFRQPENGITCYEDLGVLKLLSHIRTEELDDFVQETFGTLMAYDSQNGTELLHTLEIYFQENESMSLAAERLFIHANTLRNRLKKIENILGVNLSQADVLCRFCVACQALRIIRQTM